MSTGCKSSHNGFLGVSRSNGGLSISGWIGQQLSCLTIFSTSFGLALLAYSGFDFIVFLLFFFCTYVYFSFCTAVFLFVFVLPSSVIKNDKRGLCRRAVSVRLSVSHVRVFC